MKKIFFLLIIALSLSACQFDDDGGRNTDGTTPIDPTNPAVPHNPSPKDGSKSIDNIVKLSWEAEGVDSFRVLFDDKNPPEKVGRTQVVSNETTLFAKGEGEMYYWRVVSLLGNGRELAGPVWRFTTEEQQQTPPGFVMIKHSLTTEPPNKVKILFQVLDLEERGVTNLTINDFELYENAEELSILESNLSITKRLDNNYNLKTVLMLDNSTSITDDDPANLPTIKNAAIDFVNIMEQQQEISVFKFSSQPENVIDFTGYNDRFRITNAINGIQRGARSTNLYGAVIRGAQELTESFNANLIEQSYMILFTDGDDTQGSRTLNEALDAVAGKNVYTVGLGVDIDPEVLDLIGTEGYFQINEASELTQIFSEIQDDIVQLANSFYWMEYESPKRGNKEHLLNLFIKDNQINSYVEGTFSSAGFFDAEPGVYFNSSFGDPIGDQDVALLPGGNGATIKVQTYGGQDNVVPVYSWQSSPFLDYTDLSAAQNRSEMLIKAKVNAPAGQKIPITVFDVTNGFSKTLNFIILSPPSSIVFTDVNGNPLASNTVGIKPGTSGEVVKVSTTNMKQNPSYNWDSNVWLIYDYQTSNNSQVRISTFNNAPIGQSFDVQVTDVNNNASSTIKFVILAP